MSEQRYQAVLAVIGEGGSVSEVAGRWGVSRQSVHSWLARYEAGGLEGLADRSHRPASCPHQMAPGVEAVVLEMRRCTAVVGGGECVFTEPDVPPRLGARGRPAPKIIIPVAISLRAGLYTGYRLTGGWASCGN